VLQKKADQFIGQFNGGVTENLAVTSVAAAEDTEFLENLFGEILFHFFSVNLKIMLEMMIMNLFQRKSKSTGTTKKNDNNCLQQRGIH